MLFSENNTTIQTSRFILRLLSEDDVSETYLSWFKDRDAKKYIYAAGSVKDKEYLKEYIRVRKNRPDVIFWGIFEKNTNLHIGNIKYEPIDSEKRSAVMGILIGDVSFRGKGVSGEAIRATAIFLKNQRNIKEILLGVHKENLMAIHAYQKLGFREKEDSNLKADAPSSDILEMVLSVDQIHG